MHGDGDASRSACEGVWQHGGQAVAQPAGQQRHRRASSGARSLGLWVPRRGAPRALACELRRTCSPTLCSLPKEERGSEGLDDPDSAYQKGGWLGAYQGATVLHRGRGGRAGRGTVTGSDLPDCRIHCMSVLLDKQLVPFFRWLQISEVHTAELCWRHHAVFQPQC